MKFEAMQFMDPYATGIHYYEVTRLIPEDTPIREGRKYLKSLGYKVCDNPGIYENDKYTAYYNRSLKCWIRSKQ